MDFQLTDEQKQYCGCLVTFAQTQLTGPVDGQFPRENWHKCAAMGIMGMPLPQALGGLDSDLLTCVLAVEALAQGCRDSGLVHAILTHMLTAMQINMFGSDELKQRYLPGLAQGDCIGAQAITEPDAGSDAMAMRSTAQPGPDGYVLNGSKMFISNGPVADLMLVFAVTDPDRQSLGRISALVVEKGMPGLQQGQSLRKMGLESLQNGELVFQDCLVPQANLLGKLGQGQAIFAEGMEQERILLFAAHLGTMQRVLDTSYQHARSRKQFGKSLSEFQAISHKLAQMRVNLELGRLILYKAATIKASGRHAALESSIAKLFISESLRSCCLDALQIHGAYGYSSEYDIQQDVRDSLAATIYSGTSEMQRNIIAQLATGTDKRYA